MAYNETWEDTERWNCRDDYDETTEEEDFRDYLEALDRTEKRIVRMEEEEESQWENSRPMRD